MQFSEHFAELRTRLLYCVIAFFAVFAGCYIFSQEIYGFLVAPLSHLVEGQEGRRLIFTKLTEAFFTYIKVSFFAAFFITCPFILMQFYKFVAPGLYKREKRALLPFLIACPILFFLGAALVYYGIFPLAWKFFIGFEYNGEAGGLPIELEARVGEYLSLVMQLILAFGLAFQFPVLLNLLARAGLVSAASLAKKRKFAIVGIVTLAAIITPPDIISQIGLAVPMWLFYECSIISCRWVEQQREEIDA